MCNFPLSITMWQNQAETVYDWTGQHYENKSLTGVTCTPIGYVFLCRPQCATEYLPPRESSLVSRVTGLTVHVSNCREGWKGFTLLTP